MPKDAKKNVDRYKVSGGHLNEFEFQKNQEALAEQEHPGLSRPIPGTSPEEKAEHVKQVIQKAHQLVTKKADKRVTAQKPATQKARRSVQPLAKKASKRPTKKVAKKGTNKATKAAPIRGISAKKLAARKAAKK